MAEATAHGEAAPILVVDDDPKILQMLRLVLQSEGFAVQTAIDGREALARMAEQRPALVLLDLLLPNIDSAVLAGVIRAAFGPELPIVVVSGAARAPVLAQAIGARACIRKPFHVSELIRTVREVLEATQGEPDPAPGC